MVQGSSHSHGLCNQYLSSSSANIITGSNIATMNNAGIAGNNTAGNACEASHSTATFHGNLQYSQSLPSTSSLSSTPIFQQLQQQRDSSMNVAAAAAAAAVAAAAMSSTPVLNKLPTKSSTAAGTDVTCIRPYNSNCVSNGTNGHGVNAAQLQKQHNRLLDNWLARRSSQSDEVSIPSPLDQSLTSLQWLQNINISDRRSGCDDDMDDMDAISEIAECLDHSSGTNNRCAFNLSALSIPALNDIEFYKVSPKVRPPYSYDILVALAITSTSDIRMTLSDIFNWVMDTFPHYRTADPSWKSNMRSQIVANPAFFQINGNNAEAVSASKNGGLWTLDPKQLKLLSGPKHSKKAALASKRKDNTGRKRGSPFNTAPLPKGPGKKSRSNSVSSITSFNSTGNLNKRTTIQIKNGNLNSNPTTGGHRKPCRSLSMDDSLDSLDDRTSTLYYDAIKDDDQVTPVIASEFNWTSVLSNSMNTDGRVALSNVDSSQPPTTSIFTGDGSVVSSLEVTDSSLSPDDVWKEGPYIEAGAGNSALNISTLITDASGSMDMYVEDIAMMDASEFDPDWASAIL